MFYLGIYIWDRKWGLPLSSGLIVRMSHPVSVTSRVCSNWADLLPSCKENMLKSSPVLRWHKCAVTSYFLKSVKRIQIVTITGLIYKREPLSRHMFLSLSKAWGSSEGKTISFTLNCLGFEYIAHLCNGSPVVRPDLISPSSYNFVKINQSNHRIELIGSHCSTLGGLH